MKHLLIPIAALLLCAGCQHEAVEPTLPSPYSGVRVRITSANTNPHERKAWATIQTYSHTHPDSVFYQHDLIAAPYGREWDSDWKLSNLSVPRQADMSATFVFSGCNIALPKGAIVTLELLVNDKVLKSAVFEATSDNYVPPTGTTLTLLASERQALGN